MKNFIRALMCALIISLTVGTVSAQGITTRTIPTEQILGVREAYMFNGKGNWLTSISYTNFNNPEAHGLVWGGDLGFSFLKGKPYIEPVNAHFLGGYHATWGNFRLYGGITLGVGMATIESRAHNAVFTDESSQRQFTLTLGAQAAFLYQGDVLGGGLFISWDGNLLREHDFTVNEGLILDKQTFYRNPLTIGAMITFNLQSGTTRQDGDRSWRAGAGYLFGLGENSIDRTFVRLGKTIKQGALWSFEYGMQFEENFPERYSAAVLTIEESYLPMGSRSRVRLLAGAKVGFCNVNVSSDSFTQNTRGYLWSQQRNGQPGYVVGGWAGVDVRLFGRWHFDLNLAYDYCVTEQPFIEGAGYSNIIADPMKMLSIAGGIRYTM